MIDSHTLSLLHFDTPDLVYDEAGLIEWVTVQNSRYSPTFSSTVKKFGEGSISLNSNSVGNTASIVVKDTNMTVLKEKIRASGEYTFEQWRYITGLVSNETNRVSIFFGSIGYDIFYLGARNMNSLAIRCGLSDSNTNIGNITIPFNQWIHVAMTYKERTVRVFIDGYLVATLTNKDNWLNEDGTYFCWTRSSGGYGFIGYADECRISDICRYTENFTPQTAPFGNPMGLIKSTQPINLLDKTSITGITATGVEPANTSRRLVFQVDGTWNKLTADGAGAATLTPVTTQDLTVDSVLSEGNTVAELDAITSIQGFAGKLVYPAAALFASADASVMPTLGLTIEGEIDTTVNVYEHTDYSQEYVLGDSDVTIVSAVAETTTTGSGAVTITARLYQNGEWSEYMPLNAVQMQQASKIQLKALYTVQTTSGADSAHIDAVTITYNTAGAVVSDATTDIVTVTERFENDLAYVHAYAKHERLVDAEIEAYCSLRKQPHQRAMYQVGNGTGALATYQLPDTGVNQDTLQVYVDGKPNYDFGYNTETSQITVTADLGAVVSASYEYGWEPSTWVQMTKGSTQINDSGLCTTEYTYVIPTHSETYTVTAVKYSLVRPEGTVTNETIGVGTGKRQIIQLPHYAKTETIVCNGSWSYDYDSKRLTIIAPEGEDIVISYDWIAETPHVYGIAAGWAETIE